MADRDDKGRLIEGHTVGEATQFTEGHSQHAGVEDTQFKPGNEASTKHGGAGAVQMLVDGKPFRGLAASEERAVRAELAQSGRTELMRQEAIRLKTACNLYWGAVCKAADDGDLVKLDSYIKRYGWLASSTIRAWVQVGQAEADAGGPVAVIEAAIAAADEVETDGD